MGIYTTNSADACRYVAENCKANIIVVENHKQLQKILQVRARCCSGICPYQDSLTEDKIKKSLSSDNPSLR